MGHAFYKNFSMRKVILSRGRWDTITSHRLIPTATLVVTDLERPLYEERVGGKVAEIVEIPDAIHGIAKVRNWIIDRFDEECVFMLDGDMSGVNARTHEHGRTITDPEIIEQIVDNTYICARDVGAKVFGYGTSPKAYDFHGNKPFQMHAWVNGAIGIIGREVRFDEHQKVKEDVDLCLASLMKHRILWQDNRYYWLAKRRTNHGGMSMYRTMEKDQADAEYLKRKWGKYIDFVSRKGVMGVHVGVPRRQPGVPHSRVGK